jgi:uncharacterized protein (TIGR02246 family)
MTDDERAIRELVATWMEASANGDVDTVLSLMADDVIFMVPGREPFGKDIFRAASEAVIFAKSMCSAIGPASVITLRLRSRRPRVAPCVERDTHSQFFANICHE